ncbi:hypothetical protein LOK49_LG03G01221 [Camellia lanceoleosa]|uniref:Uncharacterized protein n=1 Tax=Camellia lanceoleosa TaxID=1840588 RepID=A0ACC0I989_9ERIC|nr:hypothetical protein LOK49_LG03G01221 [Camellia lanceoleosa]
MELLKQNMAAVASSSVSFFGIRDEDQIEMKQQLQQQQQQHFSIPTSSTTPPTTAPQKKRRNLPGTPNPDADVIALSPKTLMATNRFICEVCNKGFQRVQNLQLHRRGQNLPWKLKQKNTKEVVKRKVYLCPEPPCVHHDPSRALGDLTSIKKHYFRKHGEKKYKCEKCSKKYAVQSDWKAHSKTCGTREYRCDCGTLFSRRDSFITHRAFCDALAQETARHPSSLSTIGSHLYGSNNMSLGLSQVGSQVSSLQSHHHHPSTNLLRFGTADSAAVGAKYEQIIPPNPSSLNHPLQSVPSHALFIPDPNQGYQEQQQQHQHGLVPNKSFIGLMQLPDLQTNTNNSSSAAANLINPGFFSGSCTTTTSTMNNFNSATENHNNTHLLSPDFLMPDHQFKNGSGGSLFHGNNMSDSVGNSGLSSLYNNTSPQHESLPPAMSATALLQKAAQMGSTTSTNNGASLLKGLANSSSSTGAKSERQLVSLNFRGNNKRGGNEHRLQGLMNSLANATSPAPMFCSGSTEGDNSYIRFDGSENTFEQQHNSVNFGHMDESKLHQNFTLSIGGSNRMTLDFLGLGGGMVRNMGGGTGAGGFSQTEQQHGVDISSFDPKINSAQASHVFGAP